MPVPQKLLDSIARSLLAGEQVPPEAIAALDVPSVFLDAVHKDHCIVCDINAWFHVLQELIEFHGPDTQLVRLLLICLQDQLRLRGGPHQTWGR